MGSHIGSVLPTTLGGFSYIILTFVGRRSGDMEPLRDASVIPPLFSLPESVGWVVGAMCHGQYQAVAHGVLLESEVTCRKHLHPLSLLITQSPLCSSSFGDHLLLDAIEHSFRSCPCCQRGFTQSLDGGVPLIHCPVPLVILWLHSTPHRKGTRPGCAKSKNLWETKRARLGSADPGNGPRRA